MRVVDILKQKGTAVMTIRPTETIHALAQRLHREGIGAMIVTRDGVSLDGIVNERDVAVSLAVHGKGFHAMPVSAVMHVAVPTCSPDSKVADVAKVMTERRLRHLPVREGKQLVGVISIGDVLKHRLEEVQLESRVLRDMAIVAR